ncbi:MAG: thioredoxin family protein [Rhodobacterales bacterium]|nr:thioredoxin family protein [Rhodobacterales bacterium]
MFLRRHFFVSILALAGLFGAILPASPRAAELIMVEQDGCVYCVAWKDKIGPIYPKTPEGRFAPLRMVDIHDGPPQGITYARPVTFTPTFILIENNQEIGRIEGYPGEDFFWWMLEKLLTEKTEYNSTS